MTFKDKTGLIILITNNKLHDKTKTNTKSIPVTSTDLVAKA